MLQVVKKEGECGGEVMAGTEEKRGEEMGEREGQDAEEAKYGGDGGGGGREKMQEKKWVESGGKSSGVRGIKEKDKGKIHHRMKFVEKRKQ